MKYVIRVSNTAKGRAVIQALINQVDHSVSRTRQLHVDVLDLLTRARRDGYAAAHGGGVSNSYRGAAKTTAILAVADGPRAYLVTVGRGTAPSGPYGQVGDSVRAPTLPYAKADGHRLRASSAQACGLYNRE